MNILRGSRERGGWLLVGTAYFDAGPTLVEIDGGWVIVNNLVCVIQKWAGIHSVIETSIGVRKVFREIYRMGMICCCTKEMNSYESEMMTVNSVARLV